MLTRGQHTCMVVVADELVMASRRWRRHWHCLYALTRTASSAQAVQQVSEHSVTTAQCCQTVWEHIAIEQSIACEPPPPRGQGQLVGHHVSTANKTLRLVGEPQRKPRVAITSAWSCIRLMTAGIQDRGAGPTGNDDYYSDIRIIRIYPLTVRTSDIIFV